VNKGRLKPQLSMLQQVLADAPQQQQQQHSPLVQQHQLSASATAAVAADNTTAAAAAAIEAVEVRAQASGLAGTHGMRGIRKKNPGPECKWEMRSGLVYTKPKLYASWHSSSLEAAAAFDLVKLAVQGPGAAVNLPASMYTAEDVAAMAAFVQLKRQMHYEQQQQQQQQQQKLNAGALAQDLDSSSVLHGVQQQKQEQEQQQDIVEEQQQQQLLLQCLKVKAGRQLLMLRSKTGLEKLQALAAVTGSSSSHILSRGLRNDNYLMGVTGLKVANLQERALALQQQLGLQETALQQLLQAAPSLLILRTETIQQKIALLLPAVTELWDAAQAAAVAAAAAEGSGNATAPHGAERSRSLRREAQQQKQQQQGRRRRRKRGQQLEDWLKQQPAQQQQQQQQQIADQGQQRYKNDSNADAGAYALQRVVLCQPQVLMISADKIARRLKVLQQCCCCSSVLAAQVWRALQGAALGRWLVSGEVLKSTHHCALV
jgi:hypothetical protein